MSRHKHLREECSIIRTVINFIKTHKYCLLALYFVVFITAFFIIEANTPTEGYWVTDTALDAYIPFVPFFAIFYITWYPLFAVVGVPTMIKDEGAFKRWMYYNMIVLTATLIFDLLIPNGQHQRPANMEVNSLGTWIMSLIWAADTPTNVFPSMHVLGCIGDIAGVFDSEIFKGKWRLIITVLAVLCALSTVLVKQHAWIDTLGAFAFALPAFLLVYGKRFLSKREASPLS